MAGFRFEVGVEGLAAAYRMARAVKNLGEDTTPLLAIAGAILERSTISRFERGVGPGGIPWPVSRRVAKHGGKTLIDTGDLVGSISTALSPNEVVVGSRGLKVKEKLVNQTGSHRQSVVLAHRRMITSAFGVPLPGGPREVNVRAHGRITNIPARPFLGVDDQDRDDLADAWNEYLRSLFDGDS